MGVALRFFLVDKIWQVSPGESVRGVKNVTLSDEILQDHFPDHPVYPGTLIVEALAQLAGFLFEYSANAPDKPVRRAVLAQIEKAKFHKPAHPGDALELECRFVSELGESAQLEGTVTVRGERIARAMLTFVLMAVDSEKLHRQRRDLYAIWTRGLKLTRPIL